MYGGVGRPTRKIGGALDEYGVEPDSSCGGALEEYGVEPDSNSVGVLDGYMGCSPAKST